MDTSGFSMYISYIERNDPVVALPSLRTGAGQLSIGVIVVRGRCPEGVPVLITYPICTVWKEV